MEYYKLLYDYEKGEDILFLEINEEQLLLDRYAYEDLCIILEKEIKCHVKNATNVKLDYIANNLAWLVVSEKGKILFERCNIGDTTFIPLVNLETSERIGYLVHTNNFLDAFNERVALFSRIPYYKDNVEYEYLSVIKYALKKEIVEKSGSDLFKLKNHSIPFFVSDYLKKLIETERLTGFDFLKLR